MRGCSGRGDAADAIPPQVHKIILGDNRDAGADYEIKEKCRLYSPYQKTLHVV